MERLFFINNWLCEKGLLKAKKINTIMKLYGHIQKFPFGIQFANLIKKFISFIKQKNKGTSFKFIISPAMLYDKEKTLAFAVKASSYAGIFITAQDDKETVRIKNRIKKELSEIIDFDRDKKVIKNIYDREDIYKGKMIHKFPDLVIEPEKGYVMETKIIQKTLLRDPYLKHHGIHNREGVIVALGKDIKKGKFINDCSLKDMAATIIHLMGAPIPDDLDSNIIRDIFQSNYQFNVERDSKKSSNDKKFFNSKECLEEESLEVYARLRDLGYIDY